MTLLYPFPVLVALKLFKLFRLCVEKIKVDAQHCFPKHDDPHGLLFIADLLKVIVYVSPCSSVPTFSRVKDAGLLIDSLNEVCLFYCVAPNLKF